VFFKSGIVTLHVKYSFLLLVNEVLTPEVIQWFRIMSVFSFHVWKTGIKNPKLGIEEVVKKYINVFF